MITAVDTNILLDVVLDDPADRDQSYAALAEARQQGALVVSEIVVAELTPVLGEQVAPFLSDLETTYHLVSLKSDNPTS